MRASFVRLSDADNCVVAGVGVEAGEVLESRCEEIKALNDIPLGHKVAAQDILPGEKIYKYGAPIGSALVSIAKGEHIHVHNMKSDYLPTFTISDSEDSINES